MEEGKSLEHVKQLIENVVEELPAEDEKFFEDTIVDFRISESGADLHRTLPGTGYSENDRELPREVQRPSNRA